MLLDDSISPPTLLRLANWVMLLIPSGHVAISGCHDITLEHAMTLRLAGNKTPLANKSEEMVVNRELLRGICSLDVGYM